MSSNCQVKLKASTSYDNFSRKKKKYFFKLKNKILCTISHKNSIVCFEMIT